MDRTMKLSLQEKFPLGSAVWKLADLAVLSLLIALLANRAASVASGDATQCWLVALICEAWFTLVWLLNMNVKWNPVRFNTHPERLAQRTDELPAVDIFVTTADPKLEPPLITVNTVLSLLSLDYPADKLACYVSDDGCSPLTCYALREACTFARQWVPFCRRHSIAARAPFMHFSSGAESGGVDDEFLRDWTFVKNEYEKLVRRIENSNEHSLVQHGNGEFDEFIGVERRNHPSIIKVLSNNSKSRAAEGVPTLIYISREKSHKHNHHFKAGAMNAMIRVSAVLTNAPIMLNVDCDMFANNPQVVLHAMCLLQGSDDNVHNAYVQAPQRFYDGLKDDPFGNQLIFFKKLKFGMAGLQGMFYAGTGCFHRRKVIYGVQPDSKRGSPSYMELQAKFGSSQELIESARSIISGDLLTTPMVDVPSRIEVAKEVSSCCYENGTCWGKEIGLDYGSVTEDILTGQRIQATGWKSALLDTDPPAFLGTAPTGGPGSLSQYKRWATGSFEILLSKNNPIFHSIFKRLEFRQCLGYLVIYIWPVRAPFELCYALLGPYCLLANKSFLPKASEPGFSIPWALFITYNAYNIMDYKDCGASAQAWWNNHKMRRIFSASSWLLAFLTGLLKTVGLSETVFEVTRKDKMSDGDASTNDADPTRFTFDSSPLFIPPTALTILNIVAIGVGSCREVMGAKEVAPDAQGPGVGEFLCCGWLLLCFSPFVRGLVGKGSYGIPWSVKVKAGLLVAAFAHFCK